MPVHNSDITAILSTLADLLEIEGANTFRVRAYRDAVRTIDGMPRNISEMIASDEDLCDLPGIGESMVRN